MKFKLEIECDNAAFEGNPTPELARILEWILNDVRQDVLLDEARSLRDINGNTVGSYQLVDDEVAFQVSEEGNPD